MSETQCIANIYLDERSVVRLSPQVDHERKVAIFDLLEDNHFDPTGLPEGPYNVILSIEDNRLVFDVRTIADKKGHTATHVHTCGVQGTSGYMSPEYVMSGLLSTKVDSFALGLVAVPRSEQEGRGARRRERSAATRAVPAATHHATAGASPVAVPRKARPDARR